MSFKTVQCFPNRLLVFYQHQIAHQEKELRLIHKALPAILAQHVLHCVTNDKKLLLYTESAVWASQLRFYQDSILDAIEQNGKDMPRTLQIKILKETGESKRESGSNTNVPSIQNIALIESHSDNISDFELKQALKKLTSTLSRLRSISNLRA